ncbi:MAG TPA: response regulator [Spirochaetota bacterium]|nr:response regulator [Spirochaetota bacterium]
MKKTKISIVMGEAVVAMDMKRLLEMLGYDATAEIYREESAAAGRTDRPDLLLIDACLPGGADGYLAARRLAGEGELPVVFLVNRFGPDVVELTRGFRYCGLVAKPVAEADLYTAIRMVYSQWETERRLREAESRWRVLFERSPLAMWEANASKLCDYLCGLCASGVQDARAHFEANPDDTRHCLEMVAVWDVNDAAVALFGAANREELKSVLLTLFRDTARDHLVECFTAAAKGDITFESAARCTTLTGGAVSGTMRYSVMPGYESTRERVLCQFISSPALPQKG